jgi:hypothetical protein
MLYLEFVQGKDTYSWNHVLTVATCLVNINGKMLKGSHSLKPVNMCLVCVNLQQWN